MSLVNADGREFSQLKDKVIVISGATTGIGAEAVKQLKIAGANVVAGDIKQPEGAENALDPGFVQTDVTDYASLLQLFRRAYSLHGRIDHAISNAGIVEIDQLFGTGLDDTAIEEAPGISVLDVNLKGTVYFTRIAVHYLRKSLSTNANFQKDASIVLVSSVAGFGEWPGLFQYSASKHGVLGLLRSTKGFLLHREGIRINAVLPNMTRTGLVSRVVAAYEAAGVPVNEPEDVARTFLHALTSGANGEALYVSGGKTYEIEKKLDPVKSDWLGKELYEELLAGQRALGVGAKMDELKATRDKEQQQPER